MNYRKIYEQLIERARGRVITGYTEKHRVWPGCLGGSYKPSNVVRLTAEEHFLAHLLLIKLYPDNIKIAKGAIAMGMNSNGRKIHNKGYGWAKRKFSLSQSGSNNHMYGVTGAAHPMYGSISPLRGKFGKDHPSFGIRPSEETLVKRRIALSGKGNPNYGKGYKFEGSLNNFFGKKHTEESKRKMREAKQKRKKG